MSRASGGLTKWFAQDWVDKDLGRKMAVMPSVVVSLLKAVKGNIQNAFQNRKRTE